MQKTVADDPQGWITAAVLAGAPVLDNAKLFFEV